MHIFHIVLPFDFEYCSFFWLGSQAACKTFVYSYYYSTTCWILLRKIFCAVLPYTANHLFYMNGFNSGDEFYK